MSTVSVRDSFLRPSPPQSAQGVSMNCPVPWQRGQGTAVMTWPRIDWRTRRSSPAPWQSGQRTALLPGRAPDPSQVSQCTGVWTSTSRWTPNTASRKLRRSDHLGVGPGHADRCVVPARRPPHHPCR